MIDFINEKEERFKILTFTNKIGIGDCIEFTIFKPLSNYSPDEMANIPKKGLGLISEINDYDDYKHNNDFLKQQTITIKNEKDTINFRAIDFLNKNLELKLIKSIKEYII